MAKIERFGRPQTIPPKEAEANLEGLVVECNQKCEMTSLAGCEETSSIRSSLGNEITPRPFDLDGDLDVLPGHLYPTLDRPVRADPTGL